MTMGNCNCHIRLPWMSWRTRWRLQSFNRRLNKHDSMIMRPTSSWSHCAHQAWRYLPCYQRLRSCQSPPLQRAPRRRTNSGYGQPALRRTRGPIEGRISQFPLQSPQAKHPVRLLVRFGGDTQRACDQYAITFEGYLSLAMLSTRRTSRKITETGRAMSNQNDRDPWNLGAVLNYQETPALNDQTITTMFLVILAKGQRWAAKGAKFGPRSVNHGTS